MNSAIARLIAPRVDGCIHTHTHTHHTISGSGPHLTFFRFGCRSVCRMETKWRQSTKLHKPDKRSHHEHSTFLFENTCRTMSVFNITPRLSWRGKSKLPNEHPSEHCVKHQGIIGRFPCFPLQRGLTACRACTAIHHTVAVPVPRFQVWGSNPSQGVFFAFFPSPNFLQRSINGEYFLNNFLDWLIISYHWSHITKNCLDWGSNPRPGNVEFDVKLELSQHAVEENRESALWLPIASHSVPMGVH